MKDFLIQMTKVIDKYITEYTIQILRNKSSNKLWKYILFPYP